MGVEVPELTGWRYADSLPEVGRGYDDGAWVVADRTSTNIPTKPAFGDGRVLYGCDYGLCVFSRLDGLVRMWMWMGLMMGYLAARTSCCGAGTSMPPGRRRRRT